MSISHHLLLCATPTKALCCNYDVGLESWTELKKLLRSLDLENPNRPEGFVLRSKVDCLQVCKEGPILLIWPDGIWYGSVIPSRIEEILKKHIICNQPIEEWIIRRSPFKE